MLTGEDEVAFIGDGPLDAFALGEVHGLSNGSWEVDVPLLTFFTLNELNFSWITHGSYLVTQLDTVKRKNNIHRRFI